MAKNYKPTDSLKTDVNILMLGETGVGKSTFINSFVNYLEYTTLETARANDALCLIPTKFSLPDENFEDRIVEIGDDKNEDKEIGNSSTQDAKAYVFPLHGDSRCIRIIDTPGIGDARGLDQDKTNFENVLSYLSQFNNLHAICILLKPNVSVINPYFKFCLMHLFSHLEKSASQNIVFVFTNTRSNFYRPGETLAVLKRLLADIEKSEPYVKIPCSKDNIFCMDNEAFKFLVALQNGIKFGDREITNYSSSWDISTAASWKLLSYIAGDMNQKGLSPHHVQNTISVNEARRLIRDLSKPVADISEVIQDNLMLLGRHEKYISQTNLSLKDLQKSLYIPAILIREKPLSQPVTVCTAQTCCEIYAVSGIQKNHYKQRCHNPCYLTNVPTKVRGASELRSCAAMNPTTYRCKICRCDFSVHMHILYETELVSDKLEDDTVRTRINTYQEGVQAKSLLITKLRSRSDAIDREKKVIVETMAKFANFLQTHSITAYNDAYLEYIEYLIEREKSLGPQKDKGVINRYEQLKKQYTEEKMVLEKALHTSKIQKLVLVSATDVFTSVKSLYHLKHYGKTIKQLHKKQEDARNNAHEKTMEYYHPKQITKKTPSTEAAKSDDDCFVVLETILHEKDLEAAQIKLSTLSVNDDTRQKVTDMARKFFEKQNSSVANRNQRKDLPNYNSHKPRQHNRGQRAALNHRPNQQYNNRGNYNPHYNQNQYGNQMQHQNFQQLPFNQVPPFQHHNQRRNQDYQNQDYQYNQNQNQEQYFQQNPNLQHQVYPQHQNNTQQNYPLHNSDFNQTQGNNNTPGPTSTSSWKRVGQSNHRPYRGNRRGSRHGGTNSSQYDRLTKENTSSAAQSSSSSGSDDNSSDNGLQQEILSYIQKEIDRTKSDGAGKSVLMFYNK